MYLIVGLGNPENEYANTRHNMGFDTINKLAKENNIEVNKSKFRGLYGTGIIQGKKVILLKPQTYMNLSGEAVLECVNFYKIAVDDILIIHDDMDLPVGSVRLRMQGSGAGQKGMKNIIDLLHTTQIKRIRMGIGRDQNIDVINYVLGKFRKDEIDIFNEACDWASNGAYEFISKPFMEVMNKYNRK